jgi:hypothetical protein
MHTLTKEVFPDVVRGRSEDETERRERKGSKCRSHSSHDLSKRVEKVVLLKRAMFFTVHYVKWP